MKKEELDNLWVLYREFCSKITVSAVYVPDFLAWIDKFKLKEETKEGKDYVFLGNSAVERPVSFCTEFGYISLGKYYSTIIHNGTCNDCKNKEKEPGKCACGKEWKHAGDHNEPQIG